ncbi:MAG: MFS transporter [Flavisolibacter sp.]|nr:MFS transporter [Flavisolibacter sp.]MBD0293872.1 MFS transporter [Flavisolibacter sp.]MBD0352704.1 MFS transporter [Flavisolibacter sp.]MBD0364668.1 MFS transporter [Flavisolibacter sp.]MBD0374111.1 MFS transporter [Flavisolibacter sp.]
MLKVIPYRYRVLVLLCSLTTLTYLDRICISIVGVRVKADLGLTNEQFGWVLAAFALAYAVFEIPSGMLGDRIGPRAVFIRIVLWWSFFTAVTGLATGLIGLLIVRFLFGMGEAGTYPNCMIVMSRWFPVNEMGRSLTWVGIGSQIGAAIAPIIIVPLASAYGWRMPFFVNAAIGVVWVLICIAWFRNFPEEVRQISKSELEYIEMNRSYHTQRHLIPWRFIFKNRTLWALMLMYFCCQWAQYFFVAWMPVYLQEGRHFSENGMKVITFTLFIVGIAGFLLGGFAGDLFVKNKGLRFGRRFIGMSGLGLCGLLILLAAVLPQNKLAALCLIAANGFFSYGVMVSYAVCIDIGRNNSGTVTGAMNFFGQMGAFFLAIIFGKIVDITHDFNYPLFILAAVLFTGCLLWLAIDPTRQIKMGTPEVGLSPT